jgi:L-threonylcarbamoyladenylate synthase
VKVTIGAAIDARSERLEHVLEEVAAVIFGGGTVIFPNDTSYTVACDPYRSDAIDRVYAGKRRPDEKPLTLLVASSAEFLEYGRDNPVAPLAAKRLLPAPVILVMRRPAFITDELAAGMPTLGFRVPDDDLARAILERCGPLAATTANPSSVARYDGGADRSMLPPADLLVEHGPTKYHLESSIVDLSVTPPRLLREGAVRLERLVELLGPVERHTIKVRTQP